MWTGVIPSAEVARSTDAACLGSDWFGLPIILPSVNCNEMPRFWQGLGFSFRLQLKASPSAGSMRHV